MPAPAVLPVEVAFPVATPQNATAQAVDAESSEGRGASEPFPWAREARRKELKEEAPKEAQEAPEEEAPNGEVPKEEVPKEAPKAEAKEAARKEEAVAKEGKGAEDLEVEAALAALQTLTEDMGPPGRPPPPRPAPPVPSAKGMAFIDFFLVGERTDFFSDEDTGRRPLQGRPERSGLRGGNPSPAGEVPGAGGGAGRAGRAGRAGDVAGEVAGAGGAEAAAAHAAAAAKAAPAGRSEGQGA
ncbi:unnamed protein product [Effrenium voratum]|uniref:Uncharacterized protein n=1 Tax=Effrenium voratum TaxID=2562239 RepID=A0AA36HLI0_9DINO|nr:unnamed protein product [Effrenium voratum]